MPSDDFNHLTARRVVTLQGALNFRDCGGYATEDGRHTKWKKLFRAGALAQLTDQDHALLEPFQIRAICDLRSAEERQRSPTVWRGDAAYSSWNFDGGPAKNIGRAVFDPALTSDQIAAMIAELYRGLPFRLIDPLRAVFSLILQEQLPLVVHCSAGKDRTGIVIAVIMMTLGVARESVLADYTESARSTDYEKELREKPNNTLGMGANLGIGEQGHSMAQMPAAARAALLASSPDYLIESLNEIERRHGSVPRFVAECLGITSAEQERVRSILLE